MTRLEEWTNWVQHNEQALLFVVMGLAVAGLFLELVSFFLPWYLVYVYWIYSLDGIFPWFVSGNTVIPGLWAMKGLFSCGILIGSVLGLVVLGGFVFLHRRYGISLFRWIALLIVMVLPWMSTTSLYILCGYPTGVPNGPTMIEISYVAVFSIGFYVNLGASLLLLLALSLSIGKMFVEFGSRDWFPRRPYFLIPLLGCTVFLLLSGFLPWYVDKPNSYSPEFLLPLTFGMSILFISVFLLRKEENGITSTLLLITALPLLAGPTDPDLLRSLFNFGVPLGFVVFQVSALMLVIVCSVWSITSITRTRADLLITKKE